MRTLTLSQSELKRRLGVPQPTVSTWLRAGVLPVTRMHSSRALEFDVAALVVLRVLCAARCLWHLPMKASIKLAGAVREGLRRERRGGRLFLLVAEHAGGRCEAHVAVGDALRLSSFGTALKVLVIDVSKFRDLIAADVERFEEVEFSAATAA